MSAASPQLADVNVLFALLWPRHVHHEAAQAWFAGQGHRSWASNNITQIGVLRLLTNTAITRGAVSASTALAALAEATRHPNHQFWPLDRPALSMLNGAAVGVTGHKQWTDLLLLRHAAERKGRLVTFDSGIANLTGRESQADLVLLQG
jgi:toxin-antitoxin system PIN domain toxin